MAELNDLQLSCGRDFHSCSSVVDALDASRDSGFKFIVVPLVHPRFERSGGVANGRSGLFTRSDLVLTSSEWSRFIVGKVSQWAMLDLMVDSRRKAAEQALQQELAWAAHLGLPAVQLPLTGPDCVPHFASVLNRVLRSTTTAVYWVQIPMVAPALGTDSPDSPDSPDSTAADPWEWWAALRQLCVPTARLCVALELTADLPSGEEILRWMGEPVKMVVVPVSIFLVNSKGFPVLSKAHQLVVKQLLKFDPQFAVSGKSGEVGDLPYLRYLKHMFKTRPEKGPVEKFAQGYEDYLQAPLQPLMDNLESQTYETFEKDPFKYAEYERAVCACLQDRVAPADRKTKVSVIMVVGAGRGPLVQMSLQAAERAGCHVRVFAVEKNPNAIVTLEGRNAAEWGGKVTVVSTDMRDWTTAERADIMVSELLGSFADNELSPECLDGAQKFLAADGVSIPQTETSFMTPVATSKLHTELVNSKDVKQLQTPYVVLFHNAYNLAPVQRVFDFVHPNPENDTLDGPDNTRFKSLKFVSQQASMMHGFAGYFESILYKEFMLSINPETHSPGMFSWFPIYFPIKTPIYVPAGATVECSIWRKATKQKVWYEWCVTKPQVSAIHNVDGSSYYIGL